MVVNKKRTILWTGLVTLVLIGLIAAFRPQPFPVDLITVTRGPMSLTVGHEGETRVIDVFSVSSPINGLLRRIESEPGDAVIANETLIAEVEPTEPELLDSRSRAEAEAQLSAAISAESLARAEFEKASAELQFATSELARSRELAVNGTISERDLEASERAFKTSSAALEVAEASMQVRQHELERARAQLMSPAEMQQHRMSCECVSITSPVDGQVLRVLRESEGFVRAGEGLIEIGNPDQLEIVVDLLSVDAVKVKEGDPALIENWGGDRPLNAVVRRVEPFGFTKTSALGIEEQRVNVVLDLVDPRADWESLGHGYQVDVRVILWQEDDVLKVPLTALFKENGEWTLFVSVDGRAQKRHVTLGHVSIDEGQVLSGLSEGELIALYPGEGIDGGVRITDRR